jgi:D-glycero-D-manno-heptose 1,7-bisphosphate phosphatase
MSRRALFLDRDGTLVEPRHYPSRPEQLVLCAGVGPRLRALQTAGFALVVITNQSGLARGYFTEAELLRMHTHLRAQLATHGVTLDGIYHCPHHIDGSVPELAIECSCRKPQPGMLQRAAVDLDLDLPRSWLVGDILDDVEAGNRAGCRAILVDIGTETTPTTRARQPAYVARDTAHALSIVAAIERLGRPADLAYLPPSWRASQAQPQTAAAGRRP